MYDGLLEAYGRVVWLSCKKKIGRQFSPLSGGKNGPKIAIFGQKSTLLIFLPKMRYHCTARLFFSDFVCFLLMLTFLFRFEDRKIPEEIPQEIPQEIPEEILLQYQWKNQMNYIDFTTTSTILNLQNDTILNWVKFLNQNKVLKKYFRRKLSHSDISPV